MIPNIGKKHFILLNGNDNRVIKELERSAEDDKKINSGKGNKSFQTKKKVEKIIRNCSSLGMINYLGGGLPPR